MGRPPHDSAHTDAPRIVVISQRQRADGCGRQPGYVAFNEAEDVLVDAAGADVAYLTLDPQAPAGRARRGAGRLYRRLTSSNRPLPRIPFTGQSGAGHPTGGRLAGGSPAGGSPASSGERYDIGVFVGYSVWDLPLLEAMHDLRERCGVLAAWFPEVWPSEFEDRRLRLEPFDLADHLFAGVADSVTALGNLLDRPVHYLPMAVDAARFAATDLDGPRPIDVLGIGRRLPHLHDALLDWSRKTSRYYIYDTLSGLQANDIRAHRENLAGTYRRTSVALTHYAKFDDPVTAGQREIPGRLWEALASGALMVGMPPDDDLQRRCLGQTVVTPLPSEPAQAVDLIDALVGPAADATATRQRQVDLALTGHDWGHRWRQLLQATGVAVPAGLASRLDHLDSLATTLSL